MLTQSEAIQIVNELHRPDAVVVKVLERSWGWGFVVNSKTYLKTGDVNDMLIGYGPVIVNKNTGRIKSYSSACSLAQCMDRYESQLSLLKGFWLVLWPLVAIGLAILALSFL